MKKYIKGLYLALVIAILSFSTTIVFAAGSPEDNQIGIKPVYPSAQVKSTSGYFHFKVDGGETINASFRVTNPSSSELTLSVSPTSAFTGVYGDIYYSTYVEKTDSYVIDRSALLENSIRIPKTITVPPGKSMDIPFEVRVPNSSGVLLGGVKFFNVADSTNNNGNMAIKTKLDKVIAIKLDFTKPATPHVDVKDAVIEPSPSGAVIKVRIENPSNVIADDVQGNVGVYDDQGKKVFTYKTPKFRMAPNTGIFFPVLWQGAVANQKYMVKVGLAGKALKEYQLEFTKKDLDNLKDVMAGTAKPIRKTLVEYKPEESFLKKNLVPIIAPSAVIVALISLLVVQSVRVRKHKLALAASETGNIEETKDQPLAS